VGGWSGDGWTTAVFQTTNASTGFSCNFNDFENKNFSIPIYTTRAPSGAII
jgi:hypothetical protein